MGDGTLDHNDMRRLSQRFVPWVLVLLSRRSDAATPTRHRTSERTRERDAGECASSRMTHVAWYVNLLMLACSSVTVFGRVPPSRTQRKKDALPPACNQIEQALAMFQRASDASEGGCAYGSSSSGCWGQSGAP